MRNGVIGALFSKPEQEMEAIENTVLQSIITHYHPLIVLTCVIHTLLIRNGINGLKRAPNLKDIQDLLEGPWKKWKSNIQHPVAKDWFQTIGGDEKVKLLERDLIRELKGFDSYDPWNQDYRGRSGYCVLSLFISLWALHWSFQTNAPDYIKDGTKFHNW